ncbi:MAG: hypothetical protein ACI92Z_002482, partial [Paracoccaceae bacterium]
VLSGGCRVWQAWSDPMERATARTTLLIWRLAQLTRANSPLAQDFEWG